MGSLSVFSLCDLFGGYCKIINAESIMLMFYKSKVAISLKYVSVKSGTTACVSV